MAVRNVFSDDASLYANYVCTDNNTTTPTTSFAGKYTYCVQYQSVKVSVNSNQSGTLYIDFSIDGVTASETLSAAITGGTGYFGVFPVENAYFRIRFTAGVLPATLVIYTVLTKAGPSAVSVPVTLSSPGSGSLQTFKSVSYILNTAGYYQSLLLNGDTPSQPWAFSSMVMLRAGTFQNARFATTKGTGYTGTVYLYVNQVQSAIGFNLTAQTSATDLVTTVTVAAGDAVAWRYSQTDLSNYYSMQIDFIQT